MTRNDESDWSDIVNWVLQALLYGEKIGLTQNICDYDTPSTIASKLNYINAVNCVGNYYEIFSRTIGEANRNEINRINFGTSELMFNLFLPCSFANLVSLLASNTIQKCYI